MTEEKNWTRHLRDSASGALAGGFVSGLAGFGTALMALGIWLYVLPPAIAVPLVLICSVSRAALDAAVDVEAARLQAGLAVRGRRTARHADRHAAGRARRSANLQTERRRDAAGVSGRALFHPHADGVSASAAGSADAAVGFAGGILGGLAGLSGPLPILWASVRGWSKDQRRGVFQIFNGTVLGAALVPADRQRLRRSRTCSGSRCWRCPAR